MNEPALLAACDAAPHDPLPRLILADCLEEAGTPGRAAVARLVRRSAKALEAGTPAAQGVLTREKNRLSKTRPCAVAWFEWWFPATIFDVFQLHRALDRRKLSRFVVRCVKETRDDANNCLDSSLNQGEARCLALLERYADGLALTGSDWQSVPGWGTPEERAARASAVGASMVWFFTGATARPLPLSALALAAPEVPVEVARWVALTAAQGCAARSGDTFEAQAPARQLHLRLLHECVPCPFDVEGDE